MLKNAACQICTDLYDMDRAVAAMPCGHTFHDDCLTRWIESARNCPTCRKPLRKNSHPIHRLFFSIDGDSSQLAGASPPKTKDPVLLEANRKLKAQVTALQSAISKLKGECQDIQDEKVALSCTLADRDEEIQRMKKAQDKLKHRIREYSSKENEMDSLKERLAHLEHVQVIVNGVDAEVTQMLEEKVGYTPQQLTYVVLLRQQLDNSKQTNEKLKRSLADLREKLTACKRNCSASESELEILRLELKQAESTSSSLKRKCEMLLKAMNSPRGVTSSLASRVVHQSPAPNFITPPSVPAATCSGLSSPHIDRMDQSLDLFNDTGANDNPDVKLALDFEDEEEDRSRKRPKMIDSKQSLTQNKYEASPVSSKFTLPIKPKSTIKLKARGKERVKPLSAISSNTLSNSESSALQRESSKTQFRSGFDGMGGQAYSFSSRTKNAMQFNVFKKPASTKVKENSPSKSQQSISDFILIE